MSVGPSSLTATTAVPLTAVAVGALELRIVGSFDAVRTPFTYDETSVVGEVTENVAWPAGFVTVMVTCELNAYVPGTSTQLPTGATNETDDVP
jgi:hypothetical protein